MSNNKISWFFYLNTTKSVIQTPLNSCYLLIMSKLPFCPQIHPSPSVFFFLVPLTFHSFSISSYSSSVSRFPLFRAPFFTRFICCRFSVHYVLTVETVSARSLDARLRNFLIWSSTFVMTGSWGLRIHET